MLDSIYHMIMTFKLFCNHVFGVEMSTFCQIDVVMSVISKSVNH